MSNALGDHIDAMNALQRMLQAVEEAKARLAAAKDAEVAAAKKKAIVDREVTAYETKVKIAEQDVDNAKDAVGEADAKITEYTNLPHGDSGSSFSCHPRSSDKR